MQLLPITTTIYRLKRCTTLVIDEISMVSAKLIDGILAVLQEVHNCELLGGGIQFILSGDFLQLPAVPNQAFEDDGVSVLYHMLVPHKIELK